MSTALAQFIQATPLCDTHEHLGYEERYVHDGPDLLQSLFDNYVTADLIVAGASPDAVKTLLDKQNPDISARFTGIQAAWEAVQYTGYGEAVRLIAREVYGIEEISAATIEAALPQHAALRAPGQRLHLLRDRAKLDHVQIDDFTRTCAPDPSGVDFFFYDISWVNFCSANFDVQQLRAETNVDIHDLATLHQAMARIFAQYAPYAIAIKSQHAYSRTLQWQARTDHEAAQVLDRYLQDASSLSEAERLCLGDWCWARGVELGIEHDLPFKLHTGYYAGHSRMPVDYIRSGNLCSLLAKYLDARFVLMHIAYPYSDELLALAKHYPNVYVDLCWAWSIDPYTASDFVRRYIHAVPANKLFIFGGDTFWPAAAVAYAYQARQWLTRTLQAEVQEGLLSEYGAMNLAQRFMQKNQYACFRVAEKKAHLLASH
ncbi:MAG: amidohydrolase family protein [Caldilineaceae bacterium]|nr:amidohydrolase family protein [Caldilineaceae bacterium]